MIFVRKIQIIIITFGILFLVSTAVFAAKQDISLEEMVRVGLENVTLSTDLSPELSLSQDGFDININLNQDILTDIPGSISLNSGIVWDPFKDKTYLTNQQLITDLTRQAEIVDNTEQLINTYYLYYTYHNVVKTYKEYEKHLQEFIDTRSQEMINPSYIEKFNLELLSYENDLNLLGEEIRWKLQLSSDCEPNLSTPQPFSAHREITLDQLINITTLEKVLTTNLRLRKARLTLKNTLKNSTANLIDIDPIRFETSLQYTENCLTPALTIRSKIKSLGTDINPSISFSQNSIHLNVSAQLYDSLQATDDTSIQSRHDAEQTEYMLKMNFLQTRDKLTQSYLQLNLINREINTLEQDTKYAKSSTNPNQYLNLQLTILENKINYHFLLNQVIKGYLHLYILRDQENFSIKNIMISQ